MLGPLNFEVFLENLTPYTTYQVEVSAFTSAGIGPWSLSVRKRTLPGGNFFSISLHICLLQESSLLVWVLK